MGTLCQLMGRWGVVCINQHYPWKGRAAIHSKRTSAHMGRALVKALVTALNLFPYRIQNELTWGWPLLLAQEQVQSPVLVWATPFTTFNLHCATFLCVYILDSINYGIYASVDVVDTYIFGWFYFLPHKWSLLDPVVSDLGDLFSDLILWWLTTEHCPL